MKKHFIAGVLCGAFLMATTSVFASSVIEATIFPSKITFFLANGLSKEVQLQESEEVLKYNNKAYVPLRLFAEGSGALVEYTQAAPETDNKHKIDVHYVAEEALSEQTSNADGNKPLEDSRELQLQDMLVLILLPHMQEKLTGVYADVITVPPVIHPDYVNVKSIERVAAFRGFDFLITLDAQPIVGPHIPVGEDVLTYRISSVGVELKNFEHLRGPDKDNFLPSYQNLLK
ncbi:Protein of unknown function (DUF3888) [Schinkia azotoformans MEV2011]|uniref:Uncharacterized protein n=1 Tax=Schinkia azotoformans MEV2011 TaxID=1348973 RepID=A0A072NRT4_SCHAZ|nr:DUF3888 domain-containing protein [Schinkia azotoformans]KEF35925.1 Protein of unknown function (DUF3888) [Schinkia azotoformans MEV2011]MEC1697517.1 DUF3888 domain-containing protein [Schinkia azotoformans]MEC1714405.1 DUF3888 domain-containing protein [Schinkia azotoformans]MEC1723730.1 DUF3888 domain-containing protein [Schinkia azotoformans]MEC1743347.1 DUF3888 domain-containing protein [Schinkia azotoformans]